MNLCLYVCSISSMIQKDTSLQSHLFAYYFSFIYFSRPSVETVFSSSLQPLPLFLLRLAKYLGYQCNLNPLNIFQVLIQ